LNFYAGLPSACIFTFHKEDHTLGNMLRTRLLKTAHVIFAAYRVSKLIEVLSHLIDRD